MRWRVAAFVLATCLTAGSARADLPPPAGKKSVSYAYEVAGLASFADWVLLAHPYRETVDGVTRSFVEVKDGKRMPVDRRNGTPKLYAVNKQAFEKWLAQYKAPRDPNDDPMAKAMFESEQVVACDHSPNPVTLLDDSDPRNEVVETFVAKRIDAKTCQLEVGTASAAAPAKRVAPVTPPQNDPPAAPEPPPAPKRSGCSGCATSADSETGTNALAMLAGLLLLRRRRSGLNCDGR